MNHDLGTVWSNDLEYVTLQQLFGATQQTPLNLQESRTGEAQTPKDEHVPFYCNIAFLDKNLRVNIISNSLQKSLLCGWRGELNRYPSES
jgi:hypothetical protein